MAGKAKEEAQVAQPLVAAPERAAPARPPATLQDVKFLKARGYKVSTLEDAQAFTDKLSAADFASYIRDRIDWTPKVSAAEVYKPREGAETVEVLLHHPIHHDSFKFSRGLHTLEVELAGLFLSFRDPVTHKPIAEIPKPAEPVKGTVTK
jgi:hypothetical protein